MGDIFDFGLDAYGKLDHDEKVGLISSLLPGFIEQGISANDSLSILQDNGLGINRSEFLGLYREVLGTEERQNRIRYVPGNKTPSESIFDVAELPLDTNYRYVIRYTYIDKQDGNLGVSYMAFDSDIIDTINELEMLGQAYAQEKYGDIKGEIVGTQMWKAFRNG